jgi:hypothetical protein
MERLVPSDFRLFARTSDAGDALPPQPATTVAIAVLAFGWVHGVVSEG